MSNNNQEINALSQITKEQKQGWIPLAFIQAGICVCVPSFLEGALLVEEMNDPGSETTKKRSYQLRNIEKAFAASVRVQGKATSSAPSSVTNTANAIVL